MAGLYVWAGLAYGGLQALLLLFAALTTFSAEEGLIKWVKKTLHKRSLYVPLLSAAYDTATDIGVVLLWHGLMQDDDLQYINMKLFFSLAVLFLFLPRILMSATMYFSPHRNRGALIAFVLFDFMWLFDFFGFFSDHEFEDLQVTRESQLIEAIFESLPQLMLQTVFVVRTAKSNSISVGAYVLMFASTFASCISITMKVLWMDRSDLFLPIATDMQLDICERTANNGYILRVCWRLCEVLSRMCVFALLFACIGGAYFPLYALLSFAVCALLRVEDWHDFDQMADALMFVVVVTWNEWSPLSVSQSCAIRRVDNAFALALIGYFIFSSFDCVMCANPDIRRADNNPYVCGLVAMVGLCYVAEMVAFYYARHWLKTEARMKRSKRGQYKADCDTISEWMFHTCDQQTVWLHFDKNDNGAVDDEVKFERIVGACFKVLVSCGLQVHSSDQWFALRSDISSHLKDAMELNENNGALTREALTTLDAFMHREFERRVKERKFSDQPPETEMPTAPVAMERL